MSQSPFGCVSQSLYECEIQSCVYVTQSSCGRPFAVTWVVIECHGGCWVMPPAMSPYRRSAGSVRCRCRWPVWVRGEPCPSRKTTMTATRRCTTGRVHAVVPASTAGRGARELAGASGALCAGTAVRPGRGACHLARTATPLSPSHHPRGPLRSPW